jgi:hypothetical protein
MRNTLPILLTAGLLVASTAQAATITFSTPPFEGSTALEVPGRQVVGNELFTAFNPATDVFAFDSTAFGLGSISFFNGVIGSLPASGVNVVVLRTFDNDADPASTFGAGNAANLIAAQITTNGPGLFVYFNSGLDLARLVYSTNLSDEQGDLRILARLTNLSGQPGRDALASFTAANFQIVTTPVPEPSTIVLLASAAVIWGGRRLSQRRRASLS